ncbi:hypothetical protein vBVpaS1601_76 [Vibrio phage vB_VpaS_1601]|uniref:hypothetical protein n=1 Tax=Vibrio phage SHOU24 TaxID=1414739 RepID=UPI0003ED1CF7|nr:hypothetical protein SHOU24_05 [Vibrio phage SHOU24]AHI61202.1 hypothetical protein SHOU24_05 [Vibrio phage SHOU24]WHM52769.1 hypothetical protein vBVpaP1601_76 [Vibrio phage vB_VpaP_1601]
MAKRIPFDYSTLRERISNAQTLNDLICRVPYASIRDRYCKQDITKAKTLHDLVRDPKKVQQSVFKLEEKIQFLLCRDWWTLPELASEVGVLKRRIELAVGRINSSGYIVKRRSRVTQNVAITEYHIISENSHD